MSARRIWTALALVVTTALPAAPARASETREHLYEAPVSCAVLCTYWVDGRDAACRPTPPAVVPSSWDDWDVDADRPDARSWFLLFEMDTTVDFDSFACLREPGRNGRYHLVTGAVPAGDLCGTGGFGCSETIELTICSAERPRWPVLGDGTCLPRGTPLRFRAFNWLDHTGRAVGRLNF